MGIDVHFLTLPFWLTQEGGAFSPGFFCKNKKAEIRLLHYISNHLPARKNVNMEFI